MKTKPELSAPNDLIDDVRQITRRNIRFGIIALLCGSFNFFDDIVHQNNISAVLVGGLLCVIAFIVWLNYRGKHNFSKSFTVISINLFLVLINFAEGNKTGDYTYFLPVLFAIPFLISNSKKYITEVAVYFSVTILSCLACIFFATSERAWEVLSAERTQHMFVINCICSLFLTGTFSFLIIHTERAYKASLYTEKKEAEAAIEMRTHFLSSVGHELRTSLNGISGAAHILQKQPLLPEQKTYLDILSYCSQQMFNLVNDILDFDKMESGKIELHPGNFNINNLLMQCPLPFYERAAEKKIALLVETDPQLKNTWVQVDDIRIIQIINNLLSNALKFTDKGYIKLKTQITAQNENTITLAINVEDTGIGIEEKNFEKIFHSFWQVYTNSTRNYGGTGLGLAIAQNLLHLMNSNLRVSSVHGKGSTFSFTLKLPKTKAEADVALLPVHEHNCFEGLQVLVADDNAMNMLLISRILEDKKINVLKAENGIEVLEQLKTNQNVHLLLLDLEMPVLNGYDTIKQMQILNSQTPVIAFTATMPDEQMLNSLMQQGFKDCIYKPFEPKDLYNKIIKFVPLTQPG